MHCPPAQHKTAFRPKFISVLKAYGPCVCLRRCMDIFSECKVGIQSWSTHVMPSSLFLRRSKTIGQVCRLDAPWHSLRMPGCLIKPSCLIKPGCLTKADCLIKPGCMNKPDCLIKPGCHTWPLQLDMLLSVTIGVTNLSKTSQSVY